MVARTSDEQILVSRIYDAPKLAAWSKGNVTLLGDAAHAMTPNLGQGACLAIEDAWALGSAIGRSSNAESAFIEYQACRRSRAYAMQMQSRVMGWIVQAESQPVLQVRNWVTRKLPEYVIRRGMQSMFTPFVQQ